MSDKKQKIRELKEELNELKPENVIDFDKIKTRAEAERRLINALFGDDADKE